MYIFKRPFFANTFKKAKTFLINQKAAHRAYGDVMVLEEIFAKLIKDYCNRNSLDYQKCLDIKYVHALLYTYSFD